jgi:hypothetical protein
MPPAEGDAYRWASGPGASSLASLASQGRSAHATWERGVPEPGAASSGQSLCGRYYGGGRGGVGHVNQVYARHSPVLRCRGVKTALDTVALCRRAGHPKS